MTFTINYSGKPLFIIDTWENRALGTGNFIQSENHISVKPICEGIIRHTIYLDDLIENVENISKIEDKFINDCKSIESLESRIKQYLYIKLEDLNNIIRDELVTFVNYWKLDLDING